MIIDIRCGPPICAMALYSYPSCDHGVWKSRLSSRTPEARQTPSAFRKDIFFDENEPQLCAAAGPDKFGGGPGSAGRLFEDMVKPVINPPPYTTPPGFGVALLNRMTGNMVNFDDCQRSTGFMYEYKGPTYTPFLQRANENEFVGPSALAKMLDQATRQFQAAEGKHIVWLFADRDAAEDVRDKFDKIKNEDLKTIEIKIFPSMETIK